MNYNPHTARAATVHLCALVRPNSTHYHLCYYWPYSYKYRTAGKFRMVLLFAYFACASACENKTINIWTIKIFAWTLTSLHAVKIECSQLELCQIFERPTQRLLISRTIKTEAKKVHKPEARSPRCAVGHRWAAWVWSCSSGIRN